MVNNQTEFGYEVIILLSNNRLCNSLYFCVEGENNTSLGNIRRTKAKPTNQLVVDKYGKIPTGEHMALWPTRICLQI